MNIRTSRALVASFLAVSLLTAPIPPAAEEQPAPAKETAPPEPPIIQIALLLDTSNSMSGLIDQAKSQLWKVINEFISAKQNGQTPVVQVALYEYGNDRLSRDSNWVRRVLPLTRDLDQVSQELFALTTNGGEEFCGAVIERAVADLEWDPSSHIYKTIFIAGNEPFTQGPVDAGAACKAAIAKGIIVNTIHCGSEKEGIEGKWKMGATVADGSFMTIDQNKAVAHIPAPQDEEIVRLNETLNGTYIAFGSRGMEAKLNQIAQDSNAAKAQFGALSSRIATKATANYWNDSWDLVDAIKSGTIKIEELKKQDLPEEMRLMTPEQIKIQVQKKEAERAEIQKKILTLNQEREKFVAAKKKESGQDDTLDQAMIKAIRAQAERKAISFK